MRSAHSQSAHDIAVRFAATEFEQKGYQVQADVRGYEKPDLINGHLPDVVATQLKFTHGQTPFFEKVIIEVETVDSKHTAHARAQAAAFQRAADAGIHTRFEIRIA